MNTDASRLIANNIALIAYFRYCFRLADSFTKQVRIYRLARLDCRWHFEKWSRFLLIFARQFDYASLNSFFDGFIMPSCSPIHDSRKKPSAASSAPCCRLPSYARPHVSHATFFISTHSNGYGDEESSRLLLAAFYFGVIMRYRAASLRHGAITLAAGVIGCAAASIFLI